MLYDRGREGQAGQGKSQVWLMVNYMREDYRCFIGSISMELKDAEEKMFNIEGP